MRPAIFSLFIGVLSYSASFAGDMRILPETIELRGPEAIQHILVQQTDGEERVVGQIAEAEVQSDNVAVAEVVDGVVYARGNGKATINATLGDQRTSRDVVVSGFDGEFSWGFGQHVLPVLTRQGCNMGACHGAVAGKGGFRLSLGAYDPPTDFYRITRETLGRRVEMADPGRSLLLTKPTMATAHKGGKRLDPHSREYRILAEWIADGCAPPAATDVVIDRIEVSPDLSIVKKGAKQELIVTAFYKDGSSQDVTDWAQFASADETIAVVDKNGLTEIIGCGEGAVTALFSSKVAIARVRSPFENQLSPELFSEAPRANFIDELVLAQLEQLRLQPSPRCSDEDFLRRAFLDTIGKLPTIKETRTFLVDPAPEKRKTLIAALLEREEYVDYWSYRWSDIFLVNGQLLRPDAVKAYYEWIRSGVSRNLSWDKMAREVITAKGLSTENGATNFYAVHQDPETVAENVSQAFLSLSIGCAKCHNHPLEKWTNDQYYAFANLFSRVRAKGWGGDPRSGDGIRTVFVEERGDLMQPRTGKPQIPAPLDGKPLDPTGTGDRREALADWLTAPDNPYFSRSITNRVWAAYFGQGLVNPVDDLRASNPASNEPLLAALSDYLVENKFDLKTLMRVIMESETYQRSGEVLSENRDDTKYLSRNFPRRLMAEVLNDAISDVTGKSDVFNKIALNDGSTQDTAAYKEGTRALELYDSAVQSYFLKTFGRNDREITCECERSNQPSMIQVLHLANGEAINDKLAAKESIVEQLVSSSKTNQEVVEEACLATLSRLPTEQERAGFLSLLAGAGEAERRMAVEDLFWALMTSREFLFQH
ncbi:MAG: DUF1553 domain-containing protein [Verrucomicrobiales bacterium]|nr:DUF1553 domain-containing protein [Verrucomicrobiales bacterium]